MNKKWGVRVCVLAMMLVWAAALSQGVNLLQQRPKRIKLSGRIIASGVPPQLSTIGRNHHTYLFSIASTDGEPQIVKLSYRFLHRDGDLPPSFFDPALQHTFKAIRDPSCDERFETLSTAYVFDDSGFKLRGVRPAIQFLTPGAAPVIPGDKLLACYTTTPNDYVSSTAPKKSRGTNTKQ